MLEVWGVDSLQEVLDASPLQYPAQVVAISRSRQSLRRPDICHFQLSLGYCSDMRTRLVITGPILMKNEAFTFRPWEWLPVTETIARRQGSSQKLPEQLRDRLVELPGVTTGTRFGGEAFFFRNRFFCHFHETRDHLFLETFVWRNVEAVVSEVPGTIPHPEYGGYGWGRLHIESDG